MREWVRLYTSAWSSPKFLGLSLAAHGLWAVGLAYSGGSESEGFIPKALAERVTRYGCDGDVDLPAELVKAGLWEPTDDGWLMHNYDERQPNVTASREANRVRQQRFRESQRTRNASVTRDPNADVTQEKRREEESREDSPQTPQGVDPFRAEAWFTEAWNESCAPLPSLRKPPHGVTAERLIRRAIEYFDRDRALLVAGIRRAAEDQHYRDGHYGYEAFCRHVERWGEDVPRSEPENAIDRRIREASERGRHTQVTGTVVEMPMARHA